MLIINNDYEIYDNEGESLDIDRIYHARDLSADTDICIKILEKNDKMRENFLSNLIDMSISDLKFSCRGYANILHLEEHGNTYFVISEYFNGKTLKTLVDEGNLKPDKINYIFNKIINCLKICHSRNIYHGSLRLDNILVDDDFNVAIYDFGFTAANRGVNIRANKDSLYFLSPHQINIDYTDVESDLFSLGVILYYCLFKKMPFGDATSEAQMIKQIDRGIDLNKEKINVMNKGLAEISKKLLSRKDKYTDYDEVLIDLSNVIYSDIDEDDEEYDDDIGGFNSPFIIKILAIVLCAVMLIMMILQM